MPEYVLGIDQSTQGTKALLFDTRGVLCCREDLPHRQIVNDKGWVEHDLDEIFANTIAVVRKLVEKSGIDPSEIRTVGISNQRETAAAWNKTTGRPVYNAIVWQCARAEAICENIRKAGHEKTIKDSTGLRLSPYFSAAKIAWILENVDGVRSLADSDNLCVGTIDTWLLYKLTGKFETDYSNAARTQLFNIRTLKWDTDICGYFGVPESALACVMPSDAAFGETDFEGVLPAPIPVHAVLGDSNGALFGQGCLEKGLVKTTYGTGSSIMMNIGPEPVFSDRVVTSIAWGIDGCVDYVLEGNINYSGAVITWLKDDMQLISSPKETEEIARRANPLDTTYIVPAFSGLGAPYWESDALAVACGMSRTTGRAEFVRAALDSIAYQIAAVVFALEDESHIKIRDLRGDGGATKNALLMQFQSDILGRPVLISTTEELSGLGAAYLAGLATGVYHKETLFQSAGHEKVLPQMSDDERSARLAGWSAAVKKAI